VDFEWDARKNALNIRKHGIPFNYAARVFLDEQRLERIDDGKDYGEIRFVTIGLVEDSEIIVVYTMRAERIRIISARGADSYEIEAYWDR
jgi:uncharacterized protein